MFVCVHDIRDAYNSSLPPYFAFMIAYVAGQPMFDSDPKEASIVVSLTSHMGGGDGACEVSKDFEDFDTQPLPSATSSKGSCKPFG